MPLAIPTKYRQQLPPHTDIDLCRIVDAYPQLPLIAVNAILRYGKISREDFNARVPLEWRDRLERLTVKLNAAAEVVVLQTPNINPTLAHMDGAINRALEEGNLLAFLWLLIEVFFSEGSEAAAYFFAALEGMAILTSPGRTTVRRLDIPAPQTLERTKLAQPKGHDGFTLGVGLNETDPNVATMMAEPSMSLRVKYLRARVLSIDFGTTTFIVVNLVDKGLKQLEEQDRDSAENLLSFRRSFLVGVCPKGAKIWQAGGDGLSDDLRQHNERQGPKLMREAEAQQFMLDFYKLFEGGTGTWNSKSYKCYERCFGINLRALQREKK